MTKNEKEVIEFDLTLKQTEALDALESPTISELLFGGAKGGAKTVFFCFFAVIYAKMIVTICKIVKVPKHPFVIGFLGRVRSVDFTNTTLVTWKKFIPSRIYEINEQKKTIVLFGKVCYHFGGLDDQENIKKFNSAEYGFVGIDQAEESARDDIATLRGTQGRAIINGVALPIKTLFTANPAECFLKEDFGLAPGSLCPPFRKYIQALPSDNTFIDSVAYIAQLREAWKHHPEILKAYVEGDWSSTVGGGFLIDRDTCERLSQIELPIINKRFWVSGDPAWLGEKTDEIVAFAFTDNRVLDCSFKFNQDTNATAADWVMLCRQYKGTDIGIDAIGVGAGVVDNCRRLVGKMVNVHAFNSSNKCEDDIADEKFFNVRAEMWWTAISELKEHRWMIPQDPELIRQLCAVKYEIRNGKIKIEDKKDIKTRLGRSPDRADPFVQGIWMKRFVKPRLVYDANEQNESEAVGHSHFRR